MLFARLLPALMLASCASMLPAPKTPAIERVEIVHSKTGLKAWLVNEPSIPIIAVRMAWHGGNASDPEHLEGSSDLMAYMMNEGAGTLKSLAYAQAMEELNMSFSCSTEPDWTVCSMLTLSKNRDNAFDLLRQALTTPRFDLEPFQRAVREKQVEIKQAQTRPGWLAARARDKALRPDHPYSRFQTENSINAISTEHLKNRHREIITRNQMLLAVVGDVSARELAPLLEQTFGDLPNSSNLPIPEVQLKPPPQQPILVPLPRPQTLIGFYAPAPKRNHPDYIGLYVLNHILGGGGFSSRLMNELREKRGLTYGIRTRLNLAQHGALWSGQTQTRNETAAEMTSLIQQELAKIHLHGPSKAELQDAKSYITGAYPLSFDSNSRIASQLIYAQQNGLGADYFIRRNSLIQNLTLQSLQQLARNWLHPEKFTFVMIGQPDISAESDP